MHVCMLCMWRVHVCMYVCMYVWYGNVMLCYVMLCDVMYAMYACMYVCM